MNREPFEKCIAALRSGRFTQGFGNLCCVSQDATYSYCCMGVMCEVAIENGINLLKQTLSYCVKYGHEGCSIFLPSEVSDWLGVDELNIAFDFDGVVDFNATYANDALKWSFDQIADALEQRLNRECPKQEKLT